MKAIVLLMLVAGIAAAQTNDVHFDVLRTVDGQSFTNAVITRATAVYAVILHDGGGQNVAFTNLPVEIRRQFQFNPTNAASEIAHNEREKEAAAAAKRAAAETLEEARKDQLFRWVNGQLVAVSITDWRYGTILQVLPDGILLKPSDFLWTHLVPDFIHCPTHGLTDGRLWHGWCRRVGTFQYETVNGAISTIDRYETGLSYRTRSDAVLTVFPPLLNPERHSQRRHQPPLSNPYLQ